MVYTELAPRRQQFHVAPAMQQPNSAVSTPFWCILKIRAIKGYSHSFRITCDMSAASLSESREQRYIKAMNNNNDNDNTIRQTMCCLATAVWCRMVIVAIQSMLASVCIHGGCHARGGVPSANPVPSCPVGECRVLIATSAHKEKSHSSRRDRVVQRMWPFCRLSLMLLLVGLSLIHI